MAWRDWTIQFSIENRSSYTIRRRHWNYAFYIREDGTDPFKGHYTEESLRRANVAAGFDPVGSRYITRIAPREANARGSAPFPMESFTIPLSFVHTPPDPNGTRWRFVRGFCTFEPEENPSAGSIRVYWRRTFLPDRETVLFRVESEGVLQCDHPVLGLSGRTAEVVRGGRQVIPIANRGSRANVAPSQTVRYAEFDVSARRRSIAVIAQEEADWWAPLVEQYHSPDATAVSKFEALAASRALRARYLTAIRNEVSRAQNIALNMVGTLPTEWCGIFAMWVARQAGAETGWGDRIPALGRDVLMMWGGTAKAVHPTPVRQGDIVVIQKASHHFVIVEREGDAITSIDGNYTPEHGNTREVFALSASGSIVSRRRKSLRTILNSVAAVYCTAPAKRCMKAATPVGDGRYYCPLHTGWKSCPKGFGPDDWQSTDREDE